MKIFWLNKTKMGWEYNLGMRMTNSPITIFEEMMKTLMEI